MRVDLRFVVQADGTVLTFGTMQRRFILKPTEDPYLAVSDGTLLVLVSRKDGYALDPVVKGRAKITHGKNPAPEKDERVGWILDLTWRQTMRNVWIVPGEGSKNKVENHRF